MMVWLNWVAFEDGQCSCWCGEHHTKSITRPTKCDGCGMKFTDAAIIRPVNR